MKSIMHFWSRQSWGSIGSSLSLSIALVLSLVYSQMAFAEKNKNKNNLQAPPPSGISLQVIKMDGKDGKDIVQIASSSEVHKTLTTAVIAAELEVTLSGPGPYTIFAPTDAAFAKLPKGTVEDLLTPQNKLKLKSILEHHAAAPAYTPLILSGLSELDMVDGPKLQVESRGGKIYVDGVEIQAAIRATNGIIYVVDTVLLGKSPSNNKN